MKKKKKYLELYYKWMEQGKMDTDGLCIYFNLQNRGKFDKIFLLMSPSEADFVSFYEENKNYLYWASDSRSPDLFNFNPLRQNIVLLMAAISGEL